MFDNKVVYIEAEDDTTWVDKDFPMAPAQNPLDLVTLPPNNPTQVPNIPPAAAAEEAPAGRERPQRNRQPPARYRDENWITG